MGVWETITYFYYLSHFNIHIARTTKSEKSCITVVLGKYMTPLEKTISYHSEKANEILQTVKFFNYHGPFTEESGVIGQPGFRNISVCSPKIIVMLITIIGPSRPRIIVSILSDLKVWHGLGKPPLCWPQITEVRAFWCKHTNLSRHREQTWDMESPYTPWGTLKVNSEMKQK